MACWNGLSPLQQQRLIEHGNLPFGYEPQGIVCDNPAEVAVETVDDVSPGPRFYCRACALEFLTAGLLVLPTDRETGTHRTLTSGVEPPP